jgi:hypothetical protein
LVRVYDWATTKTDAKGTFEVTALSPGSFEITAEHAGCGANVNVTLEPHQQRELVIRTKPTRTVHIRWVYQAVEGERSFEEGVPVHGDAFLGRRHGRFYLRQGHALRNWGSDFYLTTKDGSPFLRCFDSTAKTHGLIKSDRSFDKILEVDPNAAFDSRTWHRVAKGDVYIVKCLQGDHYAKLLVVDVHQPFGT